MESKASHVSGALPRTHGAADSVKGHSTAKKAYSGESGKAAKNAVHQRDRAGSALAENQAARAKGRAVKAPLTGTASGLARNSGAARADGGRAGVLNARLQALSPFLPSPAGVRAGQNLNPNTLQAFRSLTLSLGLPGDSLSAFMLSSFRYFSLPLDPSSLARIRKQLDRLRSGGPAAQAAAAAAGKGVELHDETLAEYAAAIDPASGRNSGGEKGGQESGGQGREQEAAGQKSPNAFNGIPALAGELAALSGEIDPRWALLNRLPGKNGAFWMVFPLNCSLDGVDFDITLRLLLENQRSLPFKALRLAADIISAGGRRLFVLDKPGEGGEAKLYLNPLPSKTEQRRLEKELGKALAPMAGSVRVLEADTALFALDGEGGFPLPVDEEA